MKLVKTFLTLIVVLVVGRVQAQPGPFVPCAVCGAGEHITNDNVVLVDIPDTNDQVNPDITCRGYENAGIIGFVPPEICANFQMLVKDKCGCVANNQCDICGQNRNVGDPNKVLVIATQPDRTCGQYESDGKGSLLTPLQCGVIAVIARAQCSCQGGGWPCFPGQAKVTVENEGLTRMDAVKIGSSVLTSDDGGYSKVYSFGHFDQNAATEYLRIQADGPMSEPLEISKDHLIYVYNNDAISKKIVVPAGDVKVGDFLVTEQGLAARVRAIHNVTRHGAFAPLTTTGNIVVNGMVASNYVTRTWLKSQVSGQILHWMEHGALAPYRLYCHLAGGCQNETYDKATGFSPWVMFWYRVEQWQLHLSATFQVAFLSFMVVPGALFAILLGKLLGASIVAVVVHLFAVMLGYLVWKKQNKKAQEKKDHPEVKA